MNKEQTTISDDQIISWLQLSNTNNIGAITFFALLSRFGGDITATLEAAPRLAKTKDFKLFPRTKAEEILENAKKEDIHIIIEKDPHYPQRLKSVNDRPPVLFVKTKDINILNSKAKNLAFVGSRNYSINGKHMCDSLINSLSNLNYDFITISGLARGIDTICHQASVKASIPTIAVLAGGVDVIYPEENEELYNQIIQEGGAIVSEMLPGTNPQANLFPRRNRIIAGLCDGLIVIEAALKSGSLISARYALEYGRDLFAIPGFPMDPRYKGNNYLLKNGAHITENYKDIIDNINNVNAQTKGSYKQKDGLLQFMQEPNDLIDEPQQTTDNPDPNQNKEALEKNEKKPKKVLDMMGYNPVSIDQLAREIGVSVDELLPEILDLELSGKITHYDENSIMRVA